MIRLDRDAPRPLAEQLVEQLRFLLASGRFRPGETLPSTRGLAEQLGISFHTVRKAYQQLADAGLLEARGGSGYRVAERAPEPREDRLERGAGVVQDALQRLVAEGLGEDEIEYLIQEQLAFFEPRAGRPKVLFAAPYRELGQACAEQLAAATHEHVRAVSPGELPEHPDADVVVAPFPLVQAARLALPHADVVGVLVQPDPEALAEIARLLPHETLGLVTRHGDAVGPLLQELRHLTGFGGPGLALPAEAGRERLAELIEAVELLVYASAARRHLRGLLDTRRSVALTPTLAPASVEAVQAAVRR